MADDLGMDDDGYDEEWEEQIEAIRDSLRTVYGQIGEMAMEVDDYLAEYRYDEVKQTLESLSALLSGTEVEEAVDLGRLCADAGRSEHADRQISMDAQIPHLTEADLPALVKPESDDDYDDLVESLRDREGRCADHIRRLFDTAEKLLDQLTTKAETGRVDQVEGLQSRMKEELSAELSSAYELWELCLVDLYNENSSNLGGMGDVASMDAWLTTRR